MLLSVLGTCSREGLPRSCYQLIVLNFFCPEHLLTDPSMTVTKHWDSLYISLETVETSSGIRRLPLALMNLGLH